jgi:hypothetical protein
LFEAEFPEPKVLFIPSQGFVGFDNYTVKANKTSKSPVDVFWRVTAIRMGLFD